MKASDKSNRGALDTLPDAFWDVVVVGTGPAGGVSASLLAARGWRVLLVDRSVWPRDKACGGCINAAGEQLLREAGLGEALANSSSLQRMELRSHTRQIAFDLPRGSIVNRSTFDQSLADSAVSLGAKFLCRTTATLLPRSASSGCRQVGDTTHRTLRLVQSGMDIPCERQVNARLVLACDGLGKTRTGLLAHEPWAAVRVASRGRLGFAITLEAHHSDIEMDTLRMCVGREGYVGMVRQNDGSIHLGAALSAKPCNAAHGPFPVIQHILADCRSPVTSQPPIHLVGTGPLTRHRATVGSGRILTLGDAAAYVEPFTGEGISWAIRAAIAAVNLLPMSPDQIPSTFGEQWNQHFNTELRPRQAWCRRLRHIIGRPALTSFSMRVAESFPHAAASIAHHISR